MRDASFGEIARLGARSDEADESGAARLGSIPSPERGPDEELLHQLTIDEVTGAIEEVRRQLRDVDVKYVRGHRFGPGRLDFEWRVDSDCEVTIARLDHHGLVHEGDYGCNRRRTHPFELRPHLFNGWQIVGPSQGF